MHCPYFTFDDHFVRTTLDEFGHVWWLASDLCHALNVRLQEAHLKKHHTVRAQMVLNGKRRKVDLVNQEGLIYLVLKSRTPRVISLQHHLAHEIALSFERG
jgi:prophage antirepressor-like protein